MKRLIASGLASALILAFAGSTAQAEDLPSIDAAFDQKVRAAHREIMPDPTGALRDAAALRRQAAAFPQSRQVLASAISDWIAAEALLSLNRPADALPVIERGLQALKGADAPGLVGELTVARGGAAAMQGRVQDALASYQHAYRLFEQAREPRGQSVALLNIAAIYWDATDFGNALRYDEQAIEAYNKDASLLLSAYNNRGNALIELKRSRDAQAEYRRALAAARTLGSPLLEVRVLQNLARAQADSGEYDAADATLNEAFRLAESGPAASWRPALYGVAAMMALRRHDLPRAADLIDRTFAGASEAAAAMPLRDFHRTAYEIFRARGEQSKALQHLEAFKKLDDESRAVAASTNAALMRAKFDFANQDLKIARGQAQLRTTITAGLLSAAAVISTLLAIGFLSIRRSRNEVRAANDQLTASNAELAKALAAKTEFLATTSHEIRTPLNGILGMTQVILADRALPGSLRNRIELVHGAGETMRALVDDILDVAKMETGELKIHPAPMNLKRLLQDTAAVWEGQAETKGVRIELSIDDAPEMIVADEVRLRQVVFNLMSNAVKFTDRGRVRLACTADGPEGAERLTIAIEDSGIGIPPDRLEEIFESFRQVDGGPTRRHGGTGLGLAICRNLARAMGGDVAVASTPGIGSSFAIELPLERASQPAVVAASRPAAETLESAHLLLVEANPLAQGILRALLTPQVAQLMIAPGLDEALRALPDGVTHVLAEAGALGTDLGAAERLARAAGEANARLTLLWPAPDPQVVETVDQWGAQLIAKPISPPDLLAALRMGYRPAVASHGVAA